MADAIDDPGTARPGLPVEVLGAGVAFTASAGVTGLAALSEQDPPSALLLLGWPVLAAVGAVVLDQQPGSRVGRTLTALSLGSVVTVAWTLVRFDGLAPSPALARGAGELAALLATTVAIGVAWAYRSPRPVGAAVTFAAAAALGGLGVLGSRAGSAPAWTAAAAWTLACVGTVGVWWLVARAARAGDRVVRRRVGSVLTTLALAGGVLAVAWAFVGGAVPYYVTAATQVLVAVAVGAQWLSTSFRPLDEHLLDAALVVGTLLTAGVTAGLVHLGSRIARQESTGTITVFTALLTAAMAAPAALWIRRAVLARRYGTGLLAPDDVARITADLHARTEPRDLLDKAARMVAAASGSRDARIVLGDDDPQRPDGWLLYPLLVGGDQVGALLVESDSPEGPEARQERVVAQLLSTVALVARAVGLAIEAEHARRDVAREREAERTRVLGDLHDGLGPALAGMSMRVQAALRTDATPEHAALLADLAAGLAASRTDLRRIVAGITPSTLDDGDLEGALRGLVSSFGGAADSPAVRLDLDLDAVPVAPALQVAVYRSVAEGITNALRHAMASAIAVSVRSADGHLTVEVTDDGTGGPVVPGVGLSSLAARADGLGGRLHVCPGVRGGTRLRLDLPLTPAPYADRLEAP